MTDLKQLSDDDLIASTVEHYYMQEVSSSYEYKKECLESGKNYWDLEGELKRRLSERNQWQDIATAPKDKTEILACDEEGTRAIISFFKPGEVLFGKIFSISYTNPRIEGSFSAKYWMPLQDPPKGD